MNFIQREEMNPKNITKQNHHPLDVIPGPKRVVGNENGGHFNMIKFKIYIVHMI
jgi:hypothetical protein